MGGDRELAVSLRSYQSQSSTRGLLWFASMPLGGQVKLGFPVEGEGGRALFYTLNLARSFCVLETNLNNQQSESNRAGAGRLPMLRKAASFASRR